MSERIVVNEYTEMAATINQAAEKMRRRARHRVWLGWAWKVVLVGGLIALFLI